MNEMFAKLEMKLREQLAGCDPSLIEEVIAQAATVPPDDDPFAYTSAVCAAAVDAIKARTAILATHSDAVNRQTDAREAQIRAVNDAIKRVEGMDDRGIRH